MDVVDVLLIILLVGSLVLGIQRGLVASIGVLIGLVAGAFAAFWLMPVVNGAWPWPSSRIAAVIAVGVVLVVVGAAIGGAIGAFLRRGVDRIKLRGIDRALGGVGSVVVAALVMSVVGTSVAATGTPVISSAVASSRVLGVISDITPAPVAAAVAQLRSAVMDQGIPQLGALLGGEVQPTSPPVALDDPALQAAAASVARVSGTAFACGRSLTGSGFVVAADRVITNAHVVAGVTTPVVELPGRPARDGRVVYFDPVVDLAVVAVDGLDAPALPISSTMPPGATGAVQGYPYGGPFTSVNAAVLSSGVAPVPDIYNGSSAPRDIYALTAVVHPGNSGGPLLTSTGAAAGVVFARAENDPNRGYAMTPDAFGPVVTAAPTLSAAVSTGTCTS
ncbi:MarP family serine protease [Microbacterium sp. CJ88]|uniref:MarP family serine protease n=1 Tax=Microbacterium sp. CJ88 TaxID=3445672 RepID=UPI003F65834E